MERDPDLSHLLDGPDGPPGADPLAAIVRRAGRLRLRVGAAVAVVVLAAGGVGGYLLGQGGSGGSSVEVAASGAHSSGPATTTPPVGPASEGADPARYTFVHDGTRTNVGGVTVRSFHAPGSGSPHLVEVSTGTMVGSATFIPSGTGQPAVEVTGADTGSPVLVLGVFTPATVARVQWSEAGKTDAAAPVDDFAGLAVPVATAPAEGAAVGTVTFSDAQGHQIGSVPVRFGKAGTCPAASTPTVTAGGGAPSVSCAVCTTSGGVARCSVSPKGVQVPPCATAGQNGALCSTKVATTMPAPSKPTTSVPATSKPGKPPAPPSSGRTTTTTAPPVTGGGSPATSA